MRMIAAPYLSFPDPMVVSGMPLNLLIERIEYEKYGA